MDLVMHGKIADTDPSKKTWVLRRAYHKFGIKEDGPGKMQQLTQNQKDDIYKMTPEDLMLFFRTSRGPPAASQYLGVLLLPEGTMRWKSVRYGKDHLPLH